MGAKRAKTEKSNKTKIVILIISIICIIVGIILFIKINKRTENNTTNNITSNIIVDNNDNTSESKIKAYIVETQKTEIVTNGAKYNSSIKVYCEKGNIESITHNGLAFEGTDLNEDGTYKIVMKPEGNLDNITATITIDTVVPKIRIDNKVITGVGIVYKLGTKATVEEAKEKYTKALLVECNSNGEIINNKEPIDITEDLKNDGYTLTQKGIYKIQLLDENNNQIEFIGKDNAFKIR